MAVEIPEYVMTEPCRALFRAWLSWRGDNLMPNRRDVRLEDIKAHLPNALILDLRSETQAIFRLVGTKIVDRLGIDPTGLNYIDMAPPHERHRRIARLVEHARQPCGSRFVVLHPYANDVYAPTESLALPVRPDGDRAGLQLFSMSEHVGDGPQIWDALKELQEMKVAEEFRYVDIGAGIPADDYADAPAPAA